MGGALRGLSSHLVASVVVLVASVVATVAMYFALLAIAIVTGAPLGSPIALPFFVIFAFVYSLIMLPANWIPATMVAVHCSSRPFVRIPISMGVSFVLSLVAGALFVGEDFFRTGGWTVAMLMWIPLGLYFWTHFSAAMILESVARVLERAKV